jgi:predicted dehydrogenase
MAGKKSDQSGRRRSGERKIRYAVVGLGHLAQVAVLPAFKQTENSELVALISGDATKRNELSRKYGIAHAGSYDEYEKCLEGADAVYIVVPNDLHREFTIRALEAGIHVLCEKPMAVTEQECRAMMETARKNGRKLMIAYRLHFEKANLAAIQLAQEGKLGDLRFFSSEFAQQVAPGNIRLASVTRGGGPVYDMGVYCINAARYLFRDEPIEVSAFSSSADYPRFKDSEEMTAVTLKFPGERLASFVCSFGAADISRYTLVGTKGVLTADPAYEYSKGLNLQITIADKSSKRRSPKRDQFAAEIAYFSECILKDKEPEPSGLEGMADIRVVEAVYESIRSSKAVQLPELAKEDRPTMRQEIHHSAHGKPGTVHAKSPSGQAA